MVLEWPAAERRYPRSKIRSSSHEKIPHVQGQENLSKTVGTGADVRRYPCTRAKESPSKMAGGANLHLGSNSIPARDAQRAQTNPVHTRTQGPHRD